MARRPRWRRRKGEWPEPRGAEVERSVSTRAPIAWYCVTLALGSHGSVTKHIGFVHGAGQISKPQAVSLTVAAMSIPQIQTISSSSLSFVCHWSRRSTGR